MNEQENTRIVRQSYGLFKSGDIQALLDLYSEDSDFQLPEIENVPFAGSIKDAKARRDFFNQRMRPKTCWRSTRKSLSHRAMKSWSWGITRGESKRTDANTVATRRSAASRPTASLDAEGPTRSRPGIRHHPWGNDISPEGHTTEGVQSFDERDLRQFRDRRISCGRTGSADLDGGDRVSAFR